MLMALLLLLLVQDDQTKTQRKRRGKRAVKVHQDTEERDHRLP